MSEPMVKFKSRSMCRTFSSQSLASVDNRSDGGIRKIEQNIFLTTLVYFAVIYSSTIVAYLTYNFESRQ